jgi:hypothetical protein
MSPNDECRAPDTSAMLPACGLRQSEASRSAAADTRWIVPDSDGDLLCWLIGDAESRRKGFWPPWSF